MRLVAWCWAVPETRVAAERERGVNRPSLRCSRSWCCTMLMSVKLVSSLLPEAKQSIPRWEADVTVQYVTSHFISRCISLSSGVPGWIKSRRYAAPGTRKAAARRNFLVCHAHTLLEFLHHLHALPERHLGTGCCSNMVSLSSSPSHAVSRWALLCA